jgi:glycosyltransferase involved in cell wall biosynthesis
MPSVAVLTPWFPNRPGDSAGAFVADSALAVAQAGWQVGVLVVRPWVPACAQRFVSTMVRGNVYATAFPPAIVKTMRVPSLPGATWRCLTDPVSDRIISRGLEQIARVIAADIIHVQTEGFGPIATHVGQKLRKPVVVTVHGINTHPKYLHASYQKKRITLGLAAADRVILVGEPLRDFFKGYIGSDGNFTVVPNGIDIPEVGRSTPIFKDGPRRLISVSNLQEGKGIDLTLYALARLASEGVSNWRYRVVGDGPDRSALSRLAARLAIADNVAFVGQVRHAEIFDWLASEDIFVLPSYREAFGIAYLEAMASGLLTIGVRGQGPSQFIANRVSGILVPPNDVDALTRTLRDVLTGGANAWRAIAREGQRIARDAYTWDNHARRLISVYEEAMATAS